MALLDIEEVGPQLKRIKLAQLDPQLMDEVITLAGEHGYEVTITASSSAHFLFRLYQAEKKREKKSLKRLKRAEKLIMKLAGLYHLRHEAEGKAQKKARDDEKKEKRAGFAMMEAELRVGARMRGLFESVGIVDEKEMQEALMVLGEAKAEERVLAARNAPVGLALMKKVLAESPEVIRIPDEREFSGELEAMPLRRGIIDLWKGERRGELPVWADYEFSPNVLLADFGTIVAGLWKVDAERSADVGVKLTEFASSGRGIGELKGLFSELGLLSGRKRGDETAPAGPNSIEKRRAPEGAGDPATGLERMHHPKSAVAADAFRQAGGGVEGMLAALQELGIDVTRLSMELRSTSAEPDTATRSREQERFSSAIRMVFDLIVESDLEGRLGGLLGADGLRISRVGYLLGASGAFELRLEGVEDARTVYLSLQDMEPARLGRKVIGAGGMISHEIWTGDWLGDFRTPDGRAFAMSEDARDVGRRGEVSVRMPDTLSFRTVTTAGAAMFREDLALRPDPENDLHADFFRALSDQGERKEVLRALLAYFELSRRSLLPDRRTPNTFVLRVRDGGRRRFTFQPTDMDGVGNFIDAKDGKPDFSDFNQDFYKAAADFAVQMHEGMLRAAERGIIGRASVPSAGRIFSEMARAAREPFAPDDEETVRARDDVFAEHDGSRIGIGFDASQYVGHTIPSQGGRSVITGPDGRVELDEERIRRTAESARSPGAQRDFMRGFAREGAKEMAQRPERVREIAIAIAEARKLPEGNPGEIGAKEEALRRLRSRACGEIAWKVSLDDSFLGAAEAERPEAAERIAAALLLGTDLSGSSGNDGRDDDRTKPERHAAL
ncbi:MAG: hypothetical protein AB1324_06165 [Candidatus Micrarchaeota archaeon]